MTIQELMKSLGLDDATISKVVEGMKTNKIFTAGEENLDIRYNKLKTDNDSIVTQLSEAKNLIEEMKKSNAGNEQLQAKVSEYEAKVQTMAEQLKKTKLEAALKVALVSEKVKDIDYLSYKLKENGELELDEKDGIKGWKEKIEGLKKQYPLQFEVAGSKKINPNKLNGGTSETLTREGILKMSYKDRAKLFEDNPEGFKEAMNASNKE